VRVLSRTVAPVGWISAAQAAFLRKLAAFVNHADDLNSSDMDLCEWRGQTVIFFNVGEQHYDNALALALSPLPLDAFLHGFFPPPAAAARPASAASAVLTRLDEPARQRAESRRARHCERTTPSRRAHVSSRARTSSQAHIANPSSRRARPPRHRPCASRT
jgi:hypothetical protein